MTGSMPEAAGRGPGEWCVVVFGGAAGIGQVTAAMARARGAEVVVADIATTGAGPAGAPDIERCDAADPLDVRRVLEGAARPGKRLGVVTTVGGGGPLDLFSVDLERWEAMIRFNLTTAYVVCSTTMEVMRDRELSGSIVTTSSSYGFKPGPTRPAYSAAKAGVVGLTRSAAEAGAPFGIRVNCVAPGGTATERVVSQLEASGDLNDPVRSTPLGRLSPPEDVAEAICFLLFAGSSVTGQVVHVNGGSFMP